MQPSRKSESFRRHAGITFGAIKNWLIAQTLDSAAVASLWLIGQLIIGIPAQWAMLWAALAFVLQFIPQIGGALSLVGPFATAIFIDQGEPIILFVGEKPLWILTLYAVIAVTDGLFLQPYLMKRTSKVPMWASITAPIILGIVLPFWGVLLAPPLLAVIYAYRARRKRPAQVIVLPVRPADGDGEARR